MAGTKTMSQLRVEIRQIKSQMKSLQNRERESMSIKEELEGALENLLLHQEELRVQNEQMRHMQEELERSHHKYFDLFEGAPIGYFTLNCQGIILEVNITGAEMLGYERKLLVQTRMSRCVKVDSQEEFTAHLQRVFSGVFSDSVELEFEHNGAKPLFVIIESVPIYGKGNRVVECRTAIMDITERKRLEEQLHHAQKLESLGVLAGGIAHDFNNLLTTISYQAGLIGRTLQSGGNVKPYLDKIEKAVLRGGELASQMLVYSGREDLDRQLINLTELIEDMHPLFQVTCSKEVVLKCDLPKELPWVYGDSSQIRQIVLNLVTNASEALLDPNGMITLSTGQMELTQGYLTQCHFASDLSIGNSVYFEVNDCGSGIDAEMLKKIFDPFFSTKFAGRGMGLAAIVGIVQSHGGAIHVSSVVGNGTTFRILFPLAPREVAAPVQSMSPEVALPWRGHGLFLVIDDEEDICVAAEIVLEQLGFSVVTARDGHEGLRLFQQYASELRGVLLDLTMPHMNGEEVFEEIREISLTVPVIISSGYTEEDVLDRFRERQVNGFIQKPYLIESLEAKIQQILLSE